MKGTSIEYSLFKFLRDQQALPVAVDLLELGEANWYGDISMDTLRQDIRAYVDPARHELLLGELDRIDRDQSTFHLFEIAKVWWQTFLQPRSMSAIDFHGTEKAMKQDLNYPLDLPQRYGMVTNLGTSEHVFNVGQVFKSMHDHTLPGGIMVHGLPFSGWVDHGFYNFNSTFYWDLARANGYAMVVCVYTELNPLKVVQLVDREAILQLAKTGQIGANSLIYAVLRKPEEDADFAVPMQGYYSGQLSATAAQAWKSLR